MSKQNKEKVLQESRLQIFFPASLTKASALTSTFSSCQPKDKSLAAQFPREHKGSLDDSRHKSRATHWNLWGSFKIGFIIITTSQLNIQIVEGGRLVMLFQTSDDASKLLCLLISAVLEAGEFGLRKKSEKIFLSPQENSVCEIGRSEVYFKAGRIFRDQERGFCWITSLCGLN